MIFIKQKHSLYQHGMTTVENIRWSVARNIKLFSLCRRESIVSGYKYIYSAHGVQGFSLH